jgi:hypothetical protein
MKKEKRYIKFEDSALQSSFLGHLNRLGVAYKLNRSGAVVFENDDAAAVINAAHRVRDAQFPWYFLKWKSEREAERFRTILKKSKVQFFGEQHPDGTWFLVRRADRAVHARLWPRVLEEKNNAHRKLHAAAEKHIGALDGRTSGRAEKVRETVRRRVRERILRSQKKTDS